MTAEISGVTPGVPAPGASEHPRRTPQVMNAEFARRGVDAVAVSADVTPGDLGGFARRGYWTRRPPGAASRIRACPCWPARSTWSWTSSGPAGRASSMIANDFSLARLKTFRDHAKGGGFGAEFS